MAECLPSLTDEPCDCPDARAFRALLGSPAGEAADQLATTLAVWKLRSMAHDLSGAHDWREVPVPYTRRHDEYDTPPLSAEEITEATRRSWQAFEAKHGYP